MHNWPGRLRFSVWTSRKGNRYVIATLRKDFSRWTILPRLEIGWDFDNDDSCIDLEIGWACFSARVEFWHDYDVVHPESMEDYMIRLRGGV